MSSYLQVVLDTTSPTINIYAPNETTTETLTLYRVESNEKLTNLQNFYFIDSQGVRHNVFFQYFGNYFEGNVNFSFFSNGLATFYAEVYDEVLNKSSFVNHTTNVIETRTEEEIAEDIRDTDESRAVRVTLVERKLEVSHQISKVSTTIKLYKTETTTSPTTEMEIDAQDYELLE